MILDALCILENEKRCTVEVQKSNDDDHERRVRYNTSCITANITDPYVNTKIDDGSDIAELMRIYKEQSAFDFSKFPNTSNRKLQFIGKEGANFEMVLRCVDDISEEELREVYNSVVGNN